MSSEKLTGNLLTPTRRGLLVGAATLSATAMLPQLALAEAPPTAQVNTTGLAVTDSEAAVGILNGPTRGWQPRKPGGGKAKTPDIEEITAKGGVPGQKRKFPRKPGP